MTTMKLKIDTKANNAFVREVRDAYKVKTGKPLQAMTSKILYLADKLNAEADVIAQQFINKDKAA